ncbi:hypothetical protein FJTKL_03636 [Diaporthe vaccinii]|uniref:Uncharacterized protein n=1 Tax=Diaporthe vaccinii TaxID=105482 RepID=A0ABR4DUW6_9PEZI
MATASARGTVGWSSQEETLGTARSKPHPKDNPYDRAHQTPVNLAGPGAAGSHTWSRTLFLVLTITIAINHYHFHSTPLHPTKHYCYCMALCIACRSDSITAPPTATLQDSRAQECDCWGYSGTVLGFGKQASATACI